MKQSLNKNPPNILNNINIKITIISILDMLCHTSTIDLKFFVVLEKNDHIYIFNEYATVKTAAAKPDQ